MESSKMYSSSRCKNRTNLCGPANYPSSQSTVQGRQWKFVYIRVYLLPWYRVFHQGIVYIKRKLRERRAQKCVPLVGALTILTCTGLQTTPFHGVQYGADNGNLCIFSSTYRHDTVFAPEQCLYQKGMESSKMYSSSRCINRTFLCGPSNYPGSWRALQGREWNFAEIRDYLSSWYRVCTKGMFISKGN